MDDSDGVGQKMEQLTIRASIWEGFNPVFTNAFSTISNITISASSRHAASVIFQGGGVCMMAGMPAAGPTPEWTRIFFMKPRDSGV